MPTYVAFLRAVNVGGRTVKMAALRDHLTGAGLGDVETYIQTGNVRFTSTLRSQPKVRSFLEGTLAEHCGFDVACMVYRPGDLPGILADAEGLPPLVDGTDIRRYVTFLAEDPDGTAADAVAALEYPGEAVRVVGRAAHWQIQGPFHQAKLSNARLEKLLGPGTTRDLKVVRTLAGMWG